MAAAGTQVSQEEVEVRPNESEVIDGGRETFQAMVMQALQLRRVYREVYILCDIKGYTPAEAGHLLNISEDAVNRRLRRARGQMRREGILPEVR